MNIRRCRDNRLQPGCSSLLLIWWSTSEPGCPSKAFSILPVAHWHNPQGTRCWINMCLALLLPSLCQDPDQIWTESGVCLDRERARSGTEPHVSFSPQHTSCRETFWLPRTIWRNLWSKQTSCEGFGPMLSLCLVFTNGFMLSSINQFTVVVSWHFYSTTCSTGTLLHDVQYESAENMQAFKLADHLCNPSFTFAEAYIFVLQSTNTNVRKPSRSLKFVKVLPGEVNY